MKQRRSCFEASRSEVRSIQGAFGANDVMFVREEVKRGGKGECDAFPSVFSGSLVFGTPLLPGAARVPRYEDGR